MKTYSKWLFARPSPAAAKQSSTGGSSPCIPPTNRHPGGRLPGWTLSETLVMMIIAGIVFVSVMDGIALFNRFAEIKVRQITGNMRLWEGYYHLRNIAATADSVATEGASLLLFCEHSAIADLSETGSMLVALYGSRIDTLMSGVSEFTLVEAREQTGTDTVRLTVHNTDGGELSLSFPIVPPAHTLVVMSLQELEKPYEYE